MLIIVTIIWKLNVTFNAHNVEHVNHVTENEDVTRVSSQDKKIHWKVKDDVLIFAPWYTMTWNVVIVLRSWLQVSGLSAIFHSSYGCNFVRRNCKRSCCLWRNVSQLHDDLKDCENSRHECPDNHRRSLDWWEIKEENIQEMCVIWFFYSDISWCKLSCQMSYIASRSE